MTRERSNHLAAFKNYFPRAQSTCLLAFFLKQLDVQSLIRGFPDERPALRSSVTCLVNDFGMETGPGFLCPRTPGRYSTEQHPGGGGIQNSQNHFVLVSVMSEGTE